MSVTFRRAPVVEVGQVITNTQYRDQALAVNDRKRSGIADWVDRVCRWWFNAFRQPTNPDEDGYAFPAQGEFFEGPQVMEPESQIQWPAAPAGGPSGSNLSSLIPQFVHGLAPFLDNEPNRLNFSDFTGLGVPLWNGFTPPQTPEDFWIVGKIQRGAVDPDNGLQYVPALQAAQSFFQIVTPTYSPHGKEAGGFYPMPVKLDSDCGTTVETGLGTPSYEIKFTGLSVDVSSAGFHGTAGVDVDGLPTITYAGSCPFGTDDTTTGHVVARLDLPFAVWVAVNDGAGSYNIDRFDRNDWLEGPYTGKGVLTRYDGGHLIRAITAFVNDFRGTPDQRDPDSFIIENIAGDFEAFFNSQYALSPSIGQQVGGEIQATYPTATSSTPLPAQTLLTFTDGRTTHDYREGFTMCGVFAKVSKLVSTVTLDVLSGTKIVATLILTPDENGDAQASKWLPAAVVPVPLSVRLKTALNIAEGGSLTFEATEQLIYTKDSHPEFICDAYLVWRMMSTMGGGIDEGGVDGRGKDETRAADFWTAFKTYGCIVNQQAAGVRDQADWVTDNPVYDTFRRLSQSMRIVQRRQFRSYEVAGGKSILRFKRYAFGLKNEKVDCFYGIAPSYNAVTKTTEGETYVVRATSGTVTYNGLNFADGHTFTAYDSSDIHTSGDAQAFVKEGIKTVALKKGLTNEWLMFMQSHCYHPSQTSIFYPDAYADYFTWNERCHFWSGTASVPEFRLYATYGYSVNSQLNSAGTAYQLGRNPEGIQAEYLAPETPSGYNYAFNSNRTVFGEDHEGFCKSCQIYRVPYEIESATIEWEGGEEIVKLVFTTRFASHPDAPATVDPDVVNWSAGDVTDLQTEVTNGWRTDDNMLREYSRHIVDASYQCVFATGDRGMGSTLSTDPDNPYGSCYPHFFFNRLIQMGFDDGNNIMDANDTRVLVDAHIQMELEIKAACGGWIDGRTSEEITCLTGEGSLYDYKYESLCFDAFHDRAIGSVVLVEPVVNTVIRAQVFNRISQCLNLLTRARVDLPFVVECNQTSYIGSMDVGADWPSPPPNCIVANNWFMLWSGSPPAATTEVSNTGWLDCGGGASIQSTSAIDGGTCNDVDHFSMFTQRVVVDYRVAVDPESLNAVPVSWRDDIESLGGFLGVKLTTTHIPYATPVSDVGDATLCGFTPFWDGASGYDLRQTVTSLSECRLFDAGSFDPGTPPGGAFGIIHRSGMSDCGSGSNVAIDFTIYTDPGFFITIPLVDP